MAADLTAATGSGRRRSRLAAIIAAGLALPLAGLIVVLATRAPATTRIADSPLVGQPAPTVSTATLDGGSFRLSDFAGQWVLVNFFATWCVPCRQEHPELIRFHERHRRVGDASVVGVIYDDSADAVRRFRRREGGAWPMLIDRGGRIALEFGVSGVPESFLVNPAGIIVAKIVGGVRAGELDRLLAEARGRGLES